MASLIGSLYVSLTADFAPFQRDMRSAEGVVSSTSTSMRRSLGLTEKSVSGLQRSMNSGIRPGALISASRTFETVQQRANLLRGALFATTAAFGGLAAALTTNVISRYLDTFTGLKNQIRVVSENSADLAGQMAAVDAIATRSRTSLSAVAVLYARIQKASPDEGAANTLRRVETINKALQLGGATAQESASAAIQFSQAIQSNRLGGDELRAVLETPLGLELAKGMDITMGKLRQLSKQGKLTADVLYKALDRIAGSVDQQFAGSVITIDRALTQADNKITLFAGELDATYGITKLLTGGILAFANNLDVLVPLLSKVAIGMGLAFATRGVQGIATRTIIAPFMAEKAIRQENVRLAAEELALAQRTANQAQNGLDQARQKVSPADVVPRSLISAAAREQEGLLAIKKQQAALAQREVELQQKLGATVATTSAAQISAANKTAAAEARVNALIAERGNLYKKGTRVSTNLTNFTSGLSQQQQRQPANVAIQQEYIGQRKAIAVQVEAINAELAQSRAALAASTARSAQLEVDAEAKAALQRAAIAKDLTIAQKQQALARMQAQIQEGKIQSTKATINTTGTGIISQRIGGAQDAVNAAASATEEAAAKLVKFNKAASITRTALGYLVGAGSSFVALFGGPVGLALTAAAAAVTYFGVKSAEAAAKQQQFLDIVKERTERLAKSNNTAGLEAETTLIDEQTKAVQNQQKIVIEGYANVASGVGLYIDALNETIVSTDSLHGTTLATFKGFFEQFKNGEISLDGLIAKTQSLKGTMNADIFNNLMETLKSFTGQLKDSSAIVNTFKEDLDKLRNQKIEIQLKLAVNRSGSPEDRDADAPKRREAEGRRQMGIAQEALREETAMAAKRKALLEDAADDGSKAVNTPAKIQVEAQRLLEQGYTNTREAAEELAKKELDLRENQRQAGKAASQAASEYKKLQTIMNELNATASGAFLSDLDRDVLDKAKGLKDGSKLMQQYVDSINSGNLGGAPKELLQIRDALQQIGAAETWRGIIQQYGTGAQLAQQFADKQRELNILVAAGKITAGQSRDAWADFIGQFQDYKWIDTTADAISGFVDTAVTDFHNIGDAFQKLADDLLKIALDTFVTGPLKNLLRGWLADIAGGGSTGGGASGGASGGFNPFAAIASLFGGNSAKSGAGNAVAASAQTFASAGATKTGIPLAEVTAQGLVAKVDATYASRFQGLFNDLDKAGYKISSLGEGGYSYRNVAGTNNLSKHAFGDAVDINPRQNPQAYGATGNFAASGIDPAALAKKNGLLWGGDWNKPDTMHFQVDKSIKTLGDTADKSASALSDMGSTVTNATKALGNAVGGTGVSPTNAFLGGPDFKPTPNGFSDMLGIPAGSNGSVSGSGGMFSGIGDMFSKFLGSVFGPDGIIGKLFSSLLGPNGILSSLLSGAGDLVGGLLGMFFHSGGVVGSGGRRGMVSAAAFAGAPRYHKGNLKGNEVAAVLQKGEAVLTQNQANRMSSTVSGMSKRLSQGGGRGGGNTTIQIIDNAGVKKRTEKTSGPNGDITRIILDTVEGGVSSGRLDNAFGGRFGASPKLTKR